MLLLLQEDATGDMKIQLDTIVRNATHLKDIIEDLADVDNFQTGMAKVKRRPVCNGRLIKDVVSSYQELPASAMYLCGQISAKPI